MASDDLIRDIGHSEGFPRISIYFPTHVKGNEIAENPIRLKNALQDARQQLEDHGMEEGQIADLLSEAASKIDDHVYWRYQKPGLAVLIENGQTRFIKLPATPPELTVVAARYHVRPLVRILREGDVFHVLAVTQESTQFFDASRHSIDQASVEDMPESIERVREMTDFEDNVGYHQRSNVGPRGGQAAPSYNAQGESPEDYEEVLLEHYLRDVAKAVDQHLAHHHARGALVLAAEPRTLGRLRGFLDYGNVCEDAVQKDPKSMRPEELHAAALEIAQAHMQETSPRAKSLSRLEAWAGGDPDLNGGRALEDLIQATGEGRIEALFVSQDETVWGRIDEASGVPRIERESTAENEDLVNYLTLRVLDQGGEVFVMPDNLRGELGPMAAIYRY